MNLVEVARNLFDQVMASGSESERAFRARGWSEYQRLGLPDRRSPGWRYSAALAGLGRGDLSPAQEIFTLPEEAVRWRERLRGRFDVLVLANGRPLWAESILSPESKGLLSEFRWDQTASLNDGFQGLASAVGRGGVRLSVPDGMQVSRPLAWLHVHQGEQAWSAAQHQVEIGTGAAIDVAEIFTGSDAEYLRTESVRAAVATSGRLHWSVLQWESESARHHLDMQVSAESGAHVVLHSLQAGAAWARSALQIQLNGADSEAEVRGLTFGHGRQHVDHRVVVDHQAGNSRSSQLFKGVLGDQSRGIFNGKIRIARGAQKVVSQQLNHNLLLGPGAEADTQPELEIFADDVKANHGASIGRLDADRLFYLESRGIRPEEARALLAHAFVEDVLMKMPSPSLRQLAEDCVRERLGDFMEGMRG